MKKYLHLFPFALVFYEVATYLSNDMYLPSLPSLMQDLRITQEAVQYTLLFWFFGSASMQLIMGPLSDRYGRRNVLLIGGLFYIVFSFICAITDNFILMIIARFIQGCTVCSMVVAGYSAIHEMYDSIKAIKIIAIMGSITIMAPTLGPLLGAIVLEFYNWRAIFYILGVLGIISVGLLFKVMPETNVNRIPIDIKSILLDYKRILLRRAFWHYLLPESLLFLSLIGWLVQSPFIIEKVYHKSALVFGTIQMIVFGGLMVGAQITHRLVQYVDVFKLINYGLLISSIGASVLVFSTYYLSNDLYWIVASMTIIGIGVGILFGPLNRFAIETCHESMGARMAVSSAVLNFFGVGAIFLIAELEENSMRALAVAIAIGVFIGSILFYVLRTPEATQLNTVSNDA